MQKSDILRLLNFFELFKERGGTISVYDTLKVDRRSLNCMNLLTNHMKVL